MLNVLADAHNLAGQTELLLHGVPGGDLGGGAIGAEEVPGVEAGKVLEGAEDLVAADGGGDEAQVVRYAGVVDYGVGDHFGWILCVNRRGCGCVLIWCYQGKFNVVLVAKRISPVEVGRLLVCFFVCFRSGKSGHAMFAIFACRDEGKGGSGGKQLGSARYGEGIL